jgi:hypothetical protein
MSQDAVGYGRTDTDPNYSSPYYDSVSSFASESERSQSEENLERFQSRLWVDRAMSVEEFTKLCYMKLRVCPDNAAV